MSDVMKQLRAMAGVVGVLMGAGVAMAQPVSEPKSPAAEPKASEVKPVPPVVPPGVQPVGEGAGKKDDGAGEALPDLDALLKLPPSRPT